MILHGCKDWESRAACRADGIDPAIFYPAGSAGPAQPAFDVCDRCPVRVCCLDQAIEDRDTVAVLGGLRPVDRRKVRRLAWLRAGTAAEFEQYATLLWARRRPDIGARSGVS